VHCKLSCCVVLPPRTSPLSILSIVDPLHYIATDSEPHHGSHQRSAILLPQAKQATRLEHQSKQPPVNPSLPSSNNNSKTLSGPWSILQLAPNKPLYRPNTRTGFPVQQTSGEGGAWPRRKILSWSLVKQQMSKSRKVHFKRMGGQTVPVGIPRWSSEMRTLDQPLQHHQQQSNTTMPRVSILLAASSIASPSTMVSVNLSVDHLLIVGRRL